MKARDWLASVRRDNEILARVFDEYKQQHGFLDSIRLGDMPAQIRSQILRKAQELKEATK